MALASLKLLHLIFDKQIKYAITVSASEPAVLHKILEAGAAGGADYISPHIGLLLVILQTQKAGKKLPQWKLPIQEGGVLAEIHLLRTVRAKVMFRFYAIDYLSVFDRGFPDFTSFT